MRVMDVIGDTFVWNRATDRWCIRQAEQPGTTHCGRGLRSVGVRPGATTMLPPKVVCPDCLSALRKMGLEHWPPVKRRLWDLAPKEKA